MKYHLFNGSRALLAMGLLMMAALGQSVYATGEGQTQFIVALGNPDATSGSGTQSWGLWRQDPGPRGVRLDSYEQLKATGKFGPGFWLSFLDTVYYQFYAR
jgi:hypothetical protein